MQFMSANHLPVFICVIIVLLISCGKTASKPPAGNPGDSTGTTTPGGGTTTAKTTDIYVCGADNGKPCYWKNDTEFLLPITGSTQGLGLSIVVHGTDVYVAGYAIGVDGYSPVYWKNGTATGLYPRTTAGVPDGNAYVAESIAFADTNVYVAVNQTVLNRAAGKTAFYLKIGPSGSNTSYAVSDELGSPDIASIFVSGTDVYCAGSGLKGTGYVNSVPEQDIFASYFKNGGENFLPTSSGLLPVEDYVRGEASGIAVSGSDVYVTGWQQTNYIGADAAGNTTYCTLWKNGVPQILPWTNGGPAGGYPTSIFLADTNVYISGFVNDEAVYWKNGVITICDNSSGSGSTSSAESIGVAPNGDVYVAGNDGPTAAIWKNGTRQLLGTNANSQAAGVFVYTH